MKKQATPKRESYEKELETLLANVGKRMHQLRKEKGYNNYEIFAYENDIPRAQYGRYEQGQNMTLSSLLKVVRGYGMTLPEFFNEGFE